MQWKVSKLKKKKINIETNLVSGLNRDGNTMHTSPNHSMLGKYFGKCQCNEERLTVIFLKLEIPKI